MTTRDGSYTASLSSWGIDLSPVVKYLIIANVAVFVLQLLLTRPAAPRLPHFDPVWTDQETAEESDDDADVDSDKPPHRPSAKKKGPIKSVDRRCKRRAGPQAHARNDRARAGNAHLDRAGLVRARPQKNGRGRTDLAADDSAFCHDRYGLWHILFNMLFLGWFGQRLERMYGSREFLLFYLTAAVCASLAYVALAYYTGSKHPAIGASGAVMAVMMVYVIFYPNEQFLVFWVIPVPLWALVGVYMIYDLHPVLLAMAGDPMFTGVAHASHLGGLAFGFLYWRFGWRLEPILDRVWPNAPGLATTPRRRPPRLHTRDLQAPSPRRRSRRTRRRGLEENQRTRQGQPDRGRARHPDPSGRAIPRRQMIRAPCSVAPSKSEPKLSPPCKGGVGGVGSDQSCVASPAEPAHGWAAIKAVWRRPAEPAHGWAAIKAVWRAPQSPHGWAAIKAVWRRPAEPARRGQRSKLCGDAPQSPPRLGSDQSCVRDAPQSPHGVGSDQSCVATPRRAPTAGQRSKLYGDAPQSLPRVTVCQNATAFSRAILAPPPSGEGRGEGKI